MVLSAYKLLDYSYPNLIAIIPITGVMIGLLILSRKKPKTSKYIGFVLIGTTVTFGVESAFFSQSNIFGYAMTIFISGNIVNILLVDFIPKFYIGIIIQLVFGVYGDVRWIWKKDFELKEYLRFIVFSIVVIFQGMLVYYYMFTNKYSLIVSVVEEEKTKNGWSETMNLLETPIVIAHQQRVIYNNKMSADICEEKAINNVVDVYTDTHGHRYSVKMQRVFFNALNCVLYIFQDVTEVIKREENKFLNMLIATITHELRSPLNIISTILKILFSNLNGEPRDMASKALSACIMQENLINDILDISKMENNKFIINLAPCDIKKCMFELITLFKFQTDTKEIGLKCIFEGEREYVLMLDEKRFKQIVINLFSNSLKFTSTGYIAFAFSYKTPNLFCKIEDTGLGIKEEEKQKIFTRFGMAGSNLTINKSGTGLGLHLCQEIAKSMNGNITFDSTYGKGTTFIVQIQAEESKLSDNLIDSLPDKEVVCVDDSTTNLFVLKALLKKMGIKNSMFDDPIKCIEYVRKNQTGICVVLIDLNMPQMSGYDVAKSLLDTRIPLICLSGEDSDAVKDKCLKYGFIDVLEKPLSFERLRQLLVQLK